MSREVVEVVTPGTVLDENYLTRNANNYLLALGRMGDAALPGVRRRVHGRASRHLLCLRRARGDAEAGAAPNRAAGSRHAGVPASSEDPVTRDLLGEREGLLVNRYPDWSFDAGCLPAAAGAAVRRGEPQGVRPDRGAPEIVAAGVLLEYLGRTARRSLGHVSTLGRVRGHGATWSWTRPRSATWSFSPTSRTAAGSTPCWRSWTRRRTSPGARMLRRWILTPLKDQAAIERRLAAVESLYRDQVLLSRVRETLGGVLDLERLTARLAMDRAHAKDLTGNRIHAEVHPRGGGAAHGRERGRRGPWPGRIGGAGRPGAADSRAPAGDRRRRGPPGPGHQRGTVDASHGREPHPARLRRGAGPAARPEGQRPWRPGRVPCGGEGSAPASAH